tara:strand:+ start:5641 stop:6102 length:462 start_codon:yes stop_codon:yes gene_type:complete
MQKRYTTKDFPAYAHFPGQTPHPKKDGGHSQDLADPLSHPISDDNWHEHEDYLFGVDLFNAAFFWEAHVWWEAVWKATPKGSNRDFVQGLIKVAAAALKSRMDQSDLALDHALRARELMATKFSHSSIVFGVSSDWWKTIEKKHNETLELIFE